MMKLSTFNSAIRLLPDFLVIGAQKCGTSTLHAALAQHPCITSCKVKEPSFFDIKYERGLKWYKAHFPTLLRKAWHLVTSDRVFLTFESTVSYIYHPHAPKRIAHHLPNSKLIVMLRNPVDRAYSEYWYRRTAWHDTEFETFEKAIEYELASSIADQEYRKILSDERYSYHKYYRYSYLRRGLYAIQLQNLFRYIKRERVLVIKSEDFFHDPANEFLRILSFLRVRKWLPSRFGIKKKGSYPDMNPHTRNKLLSFFEPYNEELFKLLGTRYDWDD